MITGRFLSTTAIVVLLASPTALAAPFMAGKPTAPARRDSEALKQEVKEAAKSVNEAAKKVGHAAAHGARKAATATAHGIKKAGEAVEHAAEKVEAKLNKSDPAAKDSAH